MPKFENIQVSSKTVIAKTNATYDIQRLFENLPVVPYTVIKKKRGRKKNIFKPDPNEHIQSGSLITLKYFEHMRGVDLKPKKKSGKYFRNALSIVMKVKKKLVNFKLSKNIPLVKVLSCFTFARPQLLHSPNDSSIGLPALDPRNTASPQHTSQIIT